MFGLGLAAGFILYAILTLFRCFFRIEEGHLGVLTTFGAAEFEPGGARLRTYGPGLHRKYPWQKVHVVSTMEQNVDLSGEAGGRRAMTEDGTILRFDSILRYVPAVEHLHRFLFDLRAPLDHITSIFTCLLRNEIANFRTPESRRSGPLADFTMQAGSYALIRRERTLLNRHIADFCQRQIGDRYGVHFNAVDLVDILPPDELADALNAVIHAQTDAEAHYFRAEGECRQRLLAAEKGVAIATTRALAVEKEIDTLQSYLSDLAKAGVLADYVKRRRTEVLFEARTLFVKENTP